MFDQNLGLDISTLPGYSSGITYSTFDDYPSSSNGINWGSVINQGFGLTSQIIGAFGHNPTQQVGAGGTPIGNGYSPASILQQQTALQAAIANGQVHVGANGQVVGGNGLGLDDAAGSITSFITRNPLLVAGGVLGVFLLMREPPRSRR